MMRRIGTGIFLVVTYLLVTNPVYSQGTSAVLHCSLNSPLNVYSGSETSSPVIAKVKCGDRLFLIEPSSGSAHVRTEHGKDGFILGLNAGLWSIDPEAGPPKDNAAKGRRPAIERPALPRQATTDSTASSEEPTFGTQVGTTYGTTSGTTVGTSSGTTG